MVSFSREDDLVIALQEATKSLSDGRFSLIASVDGDIRAAERVTEVADVYVAWLRRLKRASLKLVAIEEIETGEVVHTPEGNEAMTNIDSSQRARYVVDAMDDRGFALDAELAGRSSDAAVVTVEYLQATSGTASGKDELVATFAGLGTATIEVFDPANPTVVLAADVIVANPGAVAAATLSAPVVEEIPAPPVP